MHASGSESLLAYFNAQYETILADTPDLITQAKQVRYQVYCVDHPYETSALPGCETDEFDRHAAHCLLVRRRDKAAIGTVRLILPLAKAPERSFSLHKVIGSEYLRLLNCLPLDSMGEVSRFCLAKSACGHSRDRSLQRLGIMQGLVRMTAARGVSHWCALMEPLLLRLLAAMAIRFEPSGPLIDFHGLRQPCQARVADVLSALQRERPAFWEVITDGSAFP